MPTQNGTGPVVDATGPVEGARRGDVVPQDSAAETVAQAATDTPADGGIHNSPQGPFLRDPAKFTLEYIPASEPGPGAHDTLLLILLLTHLRSSDEGLRAAADGWFDALIRRDRKGVRP